MFYLVKYYSGFIYFISHTIKYWLKNAATLLQNGVFKFVLPQNRVFEVVPSQTEVNKTVLPQNEMFNRVIHTVNSLLNIADKIMEFLISTVIHSAEKLAWTIRILLECLQHIWKMYA